MTLDPVPIDPMPGADVAAVLRDALQAIGCTYPGWRPFALGWATVDLDRAEGEFAALLDGTSGTAPAPDDVLLGARCRLLHAADPTVPRLVLLEPLTEGRLAATLVRRGEGAAVAWLHPESEAQVEPRRSVPAAGPFGLEALLLDGPIHGPYRLLVLAAPGTISP